MHGKAQVAARTPTTSIATTPRVIGGGAAAFFRDVRLLCPCVLSTSEVAAAGVDGTADAQATEGRPPPPGGAGSKGVPEITGSAAVQPQQPAAASAIAPAAAPETATTSAKSLVPAPRRTMAAVEATASHGGCRLFVGGLAETVTTEDLQTFFQRFGNVSSATVLRYGDSNKSRGFGFVTFTAAAAARAALGQSSGATQDLPRIHGKVVECAVARPRAALHPRFEVLDQGVTADARAVLLARRAEQAARCDAAVRRHNPWYDFDRRWPVDDKVDSFICGRPYRPFEVPVLTDTNADKRTGDKRPAARGGGSGAVGFGPSGRSGGGGGGGGAPRRKLRRQRSTGRPAGDAMSDDSSSDGGGLSSGSDVDDVAGERPAPKQRRLNDRLADYFTNVATIFKNRHGYSHGKTGPTTKDTFRAQYYMSVAAALRRASQPVDRAEKIARISNGRFAKPKLVDRLREVLLVLHADARAGPQRAAHMPVEDARSRAVKNLMTAWGVGPAVAQALLRQGIHSVAELQERAAAEAGGRGGGADHHRCGGMAAGQRPRLQLGKKLHLGAMAALPYTAEINQRIPRSEVTAIGEVVRAAVLDIAVRRGGLEAKQRVRVEICGSYRRGNESSGDVDMLITDTRGGRYSHCFLGELVRNLAAEGFLIAHLVNLVDDPVPDSSSPSGSYGAGSPGEVFPNTSGVGAGAAAGSAVGWPAPPQKKQSYMGICRLGSTGTARRIDIKTYPFCQFAFALLYFTGSAHFNRSMRLFAKKKLIKLSDTELFERTPSARRFRCDSEGEIFAALGLPFRAPAERNCPTDK